MADVALLYGTGSRAGLIELDAVISEGHESSADVTEHPVEAGVAITDHVRRKLRTLEIQGVVTSTPIVPAPNAVAKAVKAFEKELAGNAIVNAIPIVAGVVGDGLNAKIRARAQSGKPVIDAGGPNPYEGRPADVWAELERIKDEGQVLTVATTLGDYPSMVITSLRTSGGVDSIEVAISLKEIVIVSTETAEIPAEYLRPKSVGRQATKPAPAKAGAAATGAVDNLTGTLRFTEGLIGGPFLGGR